MVLSVQGGPSLLWALETPQTHGAPLARLDQPHREAQDDPERKEEKRSLCKLRAENRQRPRFLMHQTVSVTAVSQISSSYKDHQTTVYALKHILFIQHQVILL